MTSDSNVYLDYFGLRLKPFLITPDPAFIYPSRGHQQALAHLRYGLGREGGFVLLTGEVGTGKTTLCRLLMEELPDTFRLAYILNTKLDSAGVLSGICKELGVAVEIQGDVNGLVSAIYDNLLCAHSSGKHTVVVIEEAQNLSPDVLETLRLLTNLETSSTKLLHILLIGQPELLDTLAQPGLRQLNQRVVSRSHLGPLDKKDLPLYFRRRLKIAGTERPLFTDRAIALIYRKTGGIPRLVNLLAEHCLMGAYALGKPQVTTAIARQAAREIFATLQQPATRKTRLGVLATALVVMSIAALFFAFLPGQLGLTGIREIRDAIFVGDIADTNAPADSSDVVDADSGQMPPQLQSDMPVAAPPGPQSVVAGEQAVIEQSPSVLPGAYQLMLKEWGVDGVVVSEKHLCAVAEENNLRCIFRQVQTRSDLMVINRPMLVRLFNNSDGMDIYYVRAVNPDGLLLANSEGERRLPVEDALQQMDTSVLWLWRPPEGYTEPLHPGETNPELVTGLIRWLTASGELEEAPVTGGVYSEYLAEKVRAFQAANNLHADGILGEQTLILLTASDRAASRLNDVED